MRRITGSRASISPAVQDAMTALAALPPNQLSSAVALLSRLASMPTSSLIVATRDGSNNANNQEIPLTAGNYTLTVDSAGVVTLVTAPVVQPITTVDIALDALVTLGAIRTATLTTQMPDTNYTVVFQMNGYAGNVSFVPGSQTRTTFQYKVTALVVGTITAVAIHKG